MSESENAWFGNQDTDQKYPLKNKRDKVNYVLAFMPVRRVQIGKQVQIVEAPNLTRIQVFTPHDYDKIVNQSKKHGGDGPNYFERSNNQKVIILHDPTRNEAPAPEAEPEAETPKRTRRTRQQILDEQAEKQATTTFESSMNDEEVDNG